LAFHYYKKIVVCAGRRSITQLGTQQIRSS